MRLDRALPFRGEVVWLTPEQGGREHGPPATPEDQDYAATAYVPPATFDEGLASFVLRVTDCSSWRGEALGDWLVVANEGVQWVDSGSLIVITEGPTVVAYFHVHEVL